MSVKGSLRVGDPDEVISSSAGMQENPTSSMRIHGTCGCMAGNDALHGEQDDPRVSSILVEGKKLVGCIFLGL